jgi:hypothetical protein
MHRNLVPAKGVVIKSLKQHWRGRDAERQGSSFPRIDEENLGIFESTRHPGESREVDSHLKCNR